MLLIVSTVNAQEVPSYLKDGTITVTLKNGKTYSFPANEYAVIKRGNKTPLLSKVDVLVEKLESHVVVVREDKRHKHIISGEVVHSNSGELNSKSTPSTVDVEVRQKLGVGIQYQYNLVNDIFVGGRLDTNGSKAVNIGVGF